MTQEKPEGWIDEIEFENANIKWPFSYFDGREQGLNQAGDHNFTIALTKEEGLRLWDLGWNVKVDDSRVMEEGDEPEYRLKVKIGTKNGLPMIYFIKNGRKMLVTENLELAQIRQDSCLGIDVIIKPSPSDKWVRSDGARGVGAYVKEMYVLIKESRFGSKYADYEPI